MKEAKVKVFLCYSPGDGLTVHELYQQLSAENWIDAWLDEEKLLPGQDRDLEIKKAVKDAQAVIICISKSWAIEEGNNQRELKLALDTALNKPDGTIFIIPLKLEECDLPFKLGHIQHVNYFKGDRGFAYQQLLKSLRARADSLNTTPKKINVQTKPIETEPINAANDSPHSLSYLSKEEQFIIASNWSKENKKISLNNFDLSEQDLTEKHFIKCDLTHANLQRASLTGVYFRGATLVEADLSYAIMKNANLDNANLQNANLNSANLRLATLRDANLEGANLEGADLTDEQLKRVWCLRNAKMPNGQIYNGKYNLRGDKESITKYSAGTYEYPTLGIHSPTLKKLANSSAEYYGVDTKVFLNGQRPYLERPLLILVAIFLFVSLLLFWQFANFISLNASAGAANKDPVIAETPESVTNAGIANKDPVIVETSENNAVVFKFNNYDCPINISVIDSIGKEVLAIQIPATDTYTLNLPSGNYEYKVTADCSNQFGGAAGLPHYPTVTGEFFIYGHIIFVSDSAGKKNLYITNPDGSEQTRLTEFAAEDISISPDGTRVAFVSNANDNADIYILDIATQNVTRITDTPEKDSAPSWSHDGTRLAFASFRDGNFEIYMVNADGTNATRLTNDPASDSGPVWSPVSDEIAFTSNRYGNSDIFLLTPNGSVSTLMTSSDLDSAPAWSPDGRMIAFQSSSGDLSNICLISRDALNQRCVTSFPSDYGAPVWSPDGGFLAVRAKQSVGYGINVYNISDGSTLELSTPGIDPRGNPAWSPKGTRLVYQAQSEGSMDLYTILISTNEITHLTSTSGYEGEPVWIPK